jgi:hypothetical protein
MLTDASEKHRRQTGHVQVAPATGAVAINAAPTLESHPFTRVRVLLHDRRTLLYRLKQPPVMLASALVLLVLVVGLTAFVRTRNSGAAVAGENANAVLLPTPSPEATPAPSPTPDEAANKKAQAAKSRRTASRPVNNRNNNKKGSKVGGAFKKLKKIFNPF